MVDPLTALSVPVIPPPAPGWLPPVSPAPAGDRPPIAAGPDPVPGPSAGEAAPALGGRPSGCGRPANPAAAAARSGRAAVRLVILRRGRGVISKSEPGPLGPSPGPGPGARAGLAAPAVPGPESRSSRDVRGVGWLVIAGDHSCRRAWMGGREAARLAGGI